ncbi:hypothetical protein [Actinomycetospora straminea]|uniref:Uncharacterized protein n=1 Tax=Actinomycetospora straminea TaxID=663607 RepID=A0ABP9EZC0_9PSEU|nr:hypothetical protein [Actinomycetospora straminea]MDD7934033.1 hypothetical protein [Actinomycetospora straminea]
MSTLTTRARIGFWLCIVLALGDIAGAFVPVPEGVEGPPLVVMVFSAVMGLVTLVAAVAVARSGSRAGVRIIAVSRILSALTTLPAFFVPGVPAAFVAWGAITVVLTIVAVVLLMSRSRTRVTAGA